MDQLEPVNHPMDQFELVHGPQLVKRLPHPWQTFCKGGSNHADKNDIKLGENGRREGP